MIILHERAEHSLRAFHYVSNHEVQFITIQCHKGYCAFLYLYQRELVDDESLYHVAQD